jgi:molybdopterin synthase catalytic subunit
MLTETTPTSPTNPTNPDSTIQVRARLYALFREAAGTDSLSVAVPAGSTVRDLWGYAQAAYPGLERAAGLVASTAFAVNDTWARPDQPLHDGDEVAFLPPVSGG